MSFESRYIPAGWVSWVPTVTAAAGAFTLTTPVGRFMILGSTTVFWTLDILLNTIGTGSGEVIFTLPVTARTTTGYLGSGREDALTGLALQCRLLSASTGGVLKYDNTSIITNSRRLLISGFYEKA